MRHDVLIIGGSYAGLSAAMQIARAGKQVCVIDAGKPRNRFASASHGFFAQDGVAPLEHIAGARSKLSFYPSLTLIDGIAQYASPAENGFAIRLEDGQTMSATKIILAFGLTDILPSIPGVIERWGQTVLHCPYCHGYEIKGKRLGVLNVIPLSFHQALIIPDWGPTTFFLNGGAMPESSVLAKLAARGVTIESAPVVRLEGDTPNLTGVRLADGRLIPLDALYLASETRMASPLAEQLGCALDEGLFGPVIRTDAMKMTSVPGVYAAGDIAHFPHNSTFASADGVAAGVAAHQALVFEPLAAIA